MLNNKPVIRITKRCLEPDRLALIRDPDRLFGHDGIVERLLALGFHKIQWDLLPNQSGVYCEVFGNGYIRGEGHTLEDAAAEALSRAERQHDCQHPRDFWRFKHANGFKTCGLCGLLALASKEEVLRHHLRGEYREYGPDGRLHIYKFDQQQPLCGCGSYVLRCTEKPLGYRCPECNRFYPSYTEGMEQALAELSVEDFEQIVTDLFRDKFGQSY